MNPHPRAPYVRSSSAPAVIHTNSKENIIPVLQRISEALNGSLPLPETTFVMACKRIQTLLHFSVGQDTTHLQQMAFVDVIEDAVIAFILRVFPSVIEKLIAPTFLSCVPLSSPVTLISLLGVVDAHIYEYADFTLQLRMAAIYQLLRDNEQVTMLFSMLTAPHATPQSSSPQIDSSWWYTVGGTALIPSLTQYTMTGLQLPPRDPGVDDFAFAPPWPNIRSPLQDLPSILQSPISEAKTSLQKLPLPNFSRSYSAPDMQVALLADPFSTSIQSYHDPHIKQASLRNIPKTLSPSLFTPDPNVPTTPNMEADPLISLTASDLSGLCKTDYSSSSPPLVDLPRPQAQPSSPVSSQAFTILDDPFYNTFLTGTETVSSKRKLECTLDSSLAPRMRISTGHDYTDTTDNVVATHLALPKPKPIEGEGEGDKPTMVIKKPRGCAKNQMVSDNMADRVERKRADMMNKENLGLEG